MSIPARQHKKEPQQRRTSTISQLPFPPISSLPRTLSTILPAALSVDNNADLVTNMIAVGDHNTLAVGDTTAAVATNGLSSDSGSRDSAVGSVFTSNIVLDAGAAQHISRLSPFSAEVPQPAPDHLDTMVHFVSPVPDGEGAHCQPDTVLSGSSQQTTAVAPQRHAPGTAIIHPAATATAGTIVLPTPIRMPAGQGVASCSADDSVAHVVAHVVNGSDTTYPDVARLATTYEDLGALADRMARDASVVPAAINVGVPIPVASIVIGTSIPDVDNDPFFHGAAAPPAVDASLMRVLAAGPPSYHPSIATLPHVAPSQDYTVADAFPSDTVGRIDTSVLINLPGDLMFWR
ncbi:hypothetical protein EXIGLDRAFT_765607 [Exidia glandulosa HHB12029]|uniref:Uncharacterized protein n=1 Tax=Exidia glandulosa HHB12029 TaxID=1314781 RepID=A0A165KAU5_EXIGL|nr:hypothetical protein EXIGLDRAFT_765607 [Exidia glandulosa HHB12029]